MQKIIVAVIVFIAAIFVARRLYKAFRSQGADDACGCSGCSKCDIQSTCSLEAKSGPNDVSHSNKQ